MEYFFWLISNGFYQQKYSLGIYRKNYSGKIIIKTKQKKWWLVVYTNRITNGIKSVGKIIGKLLTLFTMLITKGITNGKLCRYFSESSEIVHFPIVLLIIVLYRQNYRQIKKSLVLFGNFLKNFD